MTGLISGSMVECVEDCVSGPATHMVKATTIATRIPSSSVSSFDVMDRFMSFNFANAVPFLKPRFLR